MLFATPVHAENDALSFIKPVTAPELVAFTTLQVPAIENLAIVSEQDANFLELRMLPGQALTNNGNRAEISIDLPHVEGDTLIYEWRLRIPLDSAADPQNRWWLIGQWHDQPDLRIGEDWNSFPDRSPSVALGYGNIDGQDTISLVYGAPDQRGITYTTLTRAEWHNLRAVIHWSTGDDGWAKIYLDDMEIPFAQARGRNMHNSFQHFFKLGIYRDRSIQVFSRIQLDDIRIRIEQN